MRRQATTPEKVFVTHVLYTKSTAELKHVTAFERDLIFMENPTVCFVPSFLGLELILLIHGWSLPLSHVASLQVCGRKVLGV